MRTDLPSEIIRRKSVPTQMLEMAELTNVAGRALFCHYTIRLKVGGLLLKSPSEEYHTFTFN